MTLLQVAQEFGVARPKNRVLPGRFYALHIESPSAVLEESQVQLASGGKPYYDIFPVGLVLYHENWNSNGTVLLLNLRIMSTAASSFILESYYRKFATQFGLAQLFKENKLISLEERESPGANQPFYFTPAFINGLGKDLNFVINKYNIDQIKEVRLIDWDDFGMLVRPKISTFGIFPENLDLISIHEKINEKIF